MRGEQPTHEQLLESLRAVRQAAAAAIEGTFSQDLTGKCRAPDESNGNAADACLRAISHTQAHVRQVRLLRGALGLTDGKTWLRQHWW